MCCMYSCLTLPKANKKTNMLWVTGLKLLGRVPDRHTYFFYYFFSGKNTILCILKGNFAFQNVLNYIFSRKPEKI